MLRIGIAGLGFMGLTHYHALRRVRGARVTAFWTRDARKRAGDWRAIQGNFGPRGGTADLRGVRTHADLDALLADPGVDLVDICLPTEFHRDATLAALRAGKHVLVEKPIALRERDGRAMAAAARAAGRKLLVAHVLPFFPAYARALQEVRSGRHGRLLGAHFKRVIARRPGPWSALDPARSAGPAVDLHIHDTHFIRLLAGQPRAVFARGLEAAGAVRYLCTQYLFGDPRLTITCASGAIAMPGRSFSHGFEIYLERGCLLFEWSSFGGRPVCPTPLTLLDARGKARRLESDPPDPLDAFVAELRYAADAVAGKNSGELLSADGALRALALCHREIESVRRGRVVAVGGRA